MSIRFTMSKNANIGEKAVYCLLYFSVSQRWYSFKWLFYNLNDVFRCSFWVTDTNTEISKMAVLLANEYHSDQKNCYKRFSSSFSHCNRSRKNDQVNWTPENVALRRNSTKMAAPLFRRIKRNIFGFWSYQLPIYRNSLHEEPGWKYVYRM